MNTDIVKMASDTAMLKCAEILIKASNRIKTGETKDLGTCVMLDTIAQVLVEEATARSKGEVP